MTDLPVEALMKQALVEVIKDVVGPDVFVDYDEPGTYENDDTVWIGELAGTVTGRGGPTPQVDQSNVNVHIRSSRPIDQPLEADAAAWGLFAAIAGGVRADPTLGDVVPVIRLVARSQRGERDETRLRRISNIEMTFLATTAS